MAPFDDRDRAFMQRALELAELGMFTTPPNPRVGCVLVADGRIIGEGWHERAGEAHAEVLALRDAGGRGESAAGSTAYVTLEPCNHHGRTPPCCDALLAARVSRVVVAMADPNREVTGGGIARLHAAGVDVSVGVLEAEARALNVGWIQRMAIGRPWVRMKIAASLDGRTALENGRSQWITSEAARAAGHRWRARASGVLTGIGTVLQDDPQLNVRAVATTRQPVKILVDRHGQLPPDARLLQDGEIIVVSAEARRQWPPRVEPLLLPDNRGRVDLRAMMDALGARGMNEIHVEAGAKLNAALLDAGVVDELLIYLAPCLIGDPARGMLARGSPLAALDGSIRVSIDSMEPIGEDWRLRARVRRTPESDRV